MMTIKKLPFLVSHSINMRFENKKASILEASGATFRFCSYAQKPPKLGAKVKKEAKKSDI
ncbi:hypothetical protein [Proteus hauseri]|uniref:hypothetical protein n=1 Tax=Proteus hauseri TaxID=183417 RepID=UPI0032DB896B